MNEKSSATPARVPADKRVRDIRRATMRGHPFVQGRKAAPRSSAIWRRDSPLVSAIRTASLRNSSVLPVPKVHLLCYTICDQRSGTKQLQVQPINVLVGAERRPIRALRRARHPGRAVRGQLHSAECRFRARVPQVRCRLPLANLGARTDPFAAECLAGSATVRLPLAGLIAIGPARSDGSFPALGLSAIQVLGP